MEYPVYSGASFIGYMDEEDCRDILRNQEGRVVRKRDDVRVMLNQEAVSRARALCNTSQRAALSTTQREELYDGLRRPGHGLTPTDGPVTGVLTVVRKYRQGVGFLNWGENEKFARRRYNPDRPATPIFATEARLRAAMMQNPEAFGRQTRAA